jgi:prepilin-type N-terminal cleavage/methylation domain-containing protein
VAKARSGYTLLELVIVLALLVVLTAMVYPSLETMYADYRVTAGADMVRAGWASARGHALNESRAYRFSIIPDRGNFRIAPDSAEFWQGGNDVPAANDPASPVFTQEGTLPKDIRFVSMESLQYGAAVPGGESAYPSGGIDPNLWVTKAVFLPDGTVLENVEQPIQTRGARPVILNLRALTGVVSVRYYTPPEGNRR